LGQPDHEELLVIRRLALVVVNREWRGADARSQPVLNRREQPFCDGTW
jgi:hypothetical protein